MNNKSICFLIILLIFLSSCKYFDKCKGDCENGYGRIEYLSGELEGDIYEGYFKSSEFHGKGEYYSRRLDITLKGQYKNGLPDSICTVIFGDNSNWEGIYTGNWINGKNIEFIEFISKTKDGKDNIFNAAHFLDTILYFYNYSNIQKIIDITATISKKDLTKEKVPIQEIRNLIDSLKIMEERLIYSIGQIDSFMEYDSRIPIKNVTIEYLTTFKLFFENEYKNWLLLIQHNPDENKEFYIWENFRPFSERIYIIENKWVETKDRFRNKYDV